MASEHEETRAFMSAFSGLKAASKKLQDMSRAAEPDLDVMLLEVQSAKRHYDDCTLIINRIKEQVESIFGDAGSDDATPVSKAASPSGDIGRIIDSRSSLPVAPTRRSGSAVNNLDDDVPFAPNI